MSTAKLNDKISIDAASDYVLKYVKFPNDAGICFGWYDWKNIPTNFWLDKKGKEIMNFQYNSLEEFIEEFNKNIDKIK